jgi:hypothetical protein
MRSTPATRPPPGSRTRPHFCLRSAVRFRDSFLASQPTDYYSREMLIGLLIGFPPIGVSFPCEESRDGSPEPSVRRCAIVAAAKGLDGSPF